MTLAAFRQLVRKPTIPLLEASLLLVKNIIDPTLDSGRWVAEIDSLAQQAADVVAEFDDPQAKMVILADWLFGPDGGQFRGNKRHYGDPRNSFLNEVLQRRLGIPISLSIVFLEVAQRLGLTLTGVGLPGHFVVGGYFTDGELPILIDPFNGGKRLSIEDCTKLITQTTGYQGDFQREWLQPTPTELILIRTLNNLRVAFMRQEDWQAAILVFQHLQVLQPKTAAHYRDEGLIHYHIRQFRQASNLLEKYLELEPKANDLDLIKSMVGDQLTRWAKLN